MTNVFTFTDMFCGIGGFHQAAASLGGECVFACDINRAARDAYAANYGLEPHGDITVLSADAIPAHDLFCAGFPCQPFSIIGAGKGFNETRGTLFFEIARILAHVKPSMVILENVKRLAGHDGGRTLGVILDVLEQKLGYSVRYKILNALDFGLPQKRERIIIVAFINLAEAARFEWPTPLPERAVLADFLENDAVVDRKYFAGDYIVKKRLASRSGLVESPAIWHENKSGHISVHPYSCALRANPSHNYLLVDGKRRLTARETLNFQGFPTSFKIAVSDAQTRMQAGNSVAVPVIRAVIEKMLEARLT